ncbi:MAG: ArsR/SmtB family transcription factor [Candidatus Acidiferrales bacterium]
MSDAAQIEMVASLIGEKGRVAMLLSLMDGSARPAGELALLADVSPQSASAHLTKLVGGQILSVVRTGRHKYYRIASAAVAHAVEALSAATPRSKDAQQKSGGPDETLRFARTCYDHLAGKLAVELAQSLQRRGLVKALEGSYEVTSAGEAWLGGIGIDAESVRSERRAFALPCLDWTERRFHIAGGLGAALLRQMLELGWIAKSGAVRTVRVTVRGKLALNRKLGMGLS